MMVVFEVERGFLHSIDNIKKICMKFNRDQASEKLKC